MPIYLRQRRYAAVAPLVALVAAIVPVINPFSAPPRSFFREAEAATISGIRSVDVMKYTKDVVTSQPSDADIDNLVDTLKSMNITHIAIAIPMDETGSYPSTGKPSPRTAEDFTQKWADTVHGKGLKIIWRGTFSGIEGLYRFTKRVGSNRFPAGTAASAPTDGSSTWLGKMYQYISGHPSYFADGDIWAPLPERTEGIFSDSTSFLPYGGAGIQANYMSFFDDVKEVSDKAFATTGKHPITGLSANNYSEVASTWLWKSMFETAGYVAVDYYGTSHTPSEMDRDMRLIAAYAGKPVFLQEWGDYWNKYLDQGSRSAYLESIYAVMNNLVRDGVLVGFNSWTGWVGTAEGILTKDSSGYHLNYAGDILAKFFSTGALASTAAPAPNPQPSTSLSCPGPAFNAFTGCYYKNQDLTSLGLVRTDSSVNFNWSTGAPVSSLSSDHFSVKWEGTFSFTGGTRTFTAATDDGVRVYVDGQLLIDSWKNQAASPVLTASRYISSGNHVVKVEYFENTGGSMAKVTWK